MTPGHILLSSDIPGNFPLTFISPLITLSIIICTWMSRQRIIYVTFPWYLWIKFTVPKLIEWNMYFVLYVYPLDQIQYKRWEKGNINVGKSVFSVLKLVLNINISWNAEVNMMNVKWIFFHLNWLIRRVFITPWLMSQADKSIPRENISSTFII
jgi:hypothetical protein